MTDIIWKDMVRLDYLESSDLEILIILMIDGPSIASKYYLQRMSLIFYELYGRECPPGMDPHFVGGYSDEIDEAVTRLKGKGIVSGGREEYILTDYGRALCRFILIENEDNEVLEGIESLKQALSSIPDKDLIAMTYVFYDHVASHPSIKWDVDRFNRTATYDGIPVLEYPKDVFESKLRDGTSVSKGA